MRLRTRLTVLTAVALAAALGSQVGLVSSSSAQPWTGPSVAGAVEQRVARPSPVRVDDTVRTVSGSTAKGLSRRVVGPNYPILVIPVYFSASAGGNATSAQATTLMDQARDWYTAVSGGRMTLQSTVLDPVKVANSCAGTTDDDALDKLTASATAAAAEQGLDSRNFAATVVMHPDCGFGWEGVATWSITGGVSTHTVLIDGPDGRAKNVVIHELGHTLRLDHANLALCYNGARYQSAYLNAASECNSYVYEDPYDTMGNDPAAGGFSGANLSALGWLSPTQLATRSSGTTSTRLTTLETGTGVRVIKVRASATVTYWIEYRRRTGVDAGIPATGVGVQVRRTVRTANNDDADEYRPATEYIDMAPESVDLNVLPSKSSWTSPEGVKVYIGTQSSSAAWVKVRFNAPKPAVPAAPALQLSSGTKALTATWAAPSDHGRPVGSYRVYVYDASGRRIRTVDLASSEVLRTRTTTISRLEPGKRYTVKIKSINDVGYSAAATARAVPR